MWQLYLVSVIAILLAIALIIQSVRVYMWQNKYTSLVQALKLGVENAESEESN